MYWKFLMLALFAAGSGALLWGATPTATAENALNITLTRFEAFPLDNAVRLEWSTDTEVDTAGYKIRRGQNGTFEFLSDPAGGVVFIAAEGGLTSGAEYEFVDTTVINGQTYTYELWEVELNSTENRVDTTVTVTVGVTPTPTPIVVGGGGGGNPTNTPVPATNTPRPTSTSTRQPTSTPEPDSPTATATRRSTATPQPSPTATQVVQSANPTNTPRANATAAGSVATSASPTPTPQPASQVLAQEPPTEATPPPEGDAYPGAPQAQDPESAFRAADEGADEPGAAAPAYPIGGNPVTAVGDQQTTQPQAETNPAAEATTGRIYLWVGFLAALVLFVTAVLGAILLFTRRRNQG